MTSEIYARYVADFHAFYKQNKEQLKPKLIAVLITDICSNWRKYTS